MSIRKGRLQKRTILTAVILAAILLLSGLGLAHEIQLGHAQRDFAALVEENAGRFNEGRLVLSSTSSREARRIADTLGGSLRITKNGRFALVTLPDGVMLADVAESRELRQYMADFSLDYNDFSVGTEETDVAEDGDIRANFQTDEPMYPQQTYLDYINIGDSWNVSMGQKSDGEKVKIAVIDSGIDTDHPEFMDADGNSVISLLSYDATDDIIVEADDLSAIEDEHGHGTAVAGVIASQINGSGIMGVAPDVELLVIKCDVDETGEFRSSADIVFGIYYAIEQNVDVINMSFSSTELSTDLMNAVQLAVDSDIIPVAAAGNDSTAIEHYPAALETTIGVGALAQDSWGLGDYSNFGENSDILAPGTTLTTTIGGGYGNEHGTSMAAPVVSAAVAIYRSQHPYATVEQVKNDLLAAGKDLGATGEDLYFGFGALDMNAFICEEKGIVTYDYCTENLKPTTQVFVKQHTIQTVPEPERGSIVFDDWYYDKGYTRVFDYDAWYTTEFVEDVTLYAKWNNEEDEGTSVYSYKSLEDGTIEIISYKGKRRYLTVPGEIDGMTVSSIGINAFAGNTRLREVVLPDGLKTVREYAFDGASRLRAVTFTGDVLERIEQRAFRNCTVLRKLDLPDSVVTIGSEAFVNCAALSAVGITNNSVLERIGEKAFSKTALSYLYLPSKVTEFDGSVLAFCRNMRNVDIHSDNAAFVTQKGMVLSADGSALIYYPAAQTGTLNVPEGVISVADYACAASAMTEMVLPDSLERIGVQSFAEARLTAVHIPGNVEQIDPGAFKNCSRMTGLTFAENAWLQTINGDSLNGGAFENCNHISVLELPESLVRLGEQSFKGCSGITKLLIPENVERIGESAFKDCGGLVTVTFEGNCVVNTIPQYCFGYCSNLRTVNFSDGIKTIERYAFTNDYLLHRLNFGTDSALSSIGDNCFYSCSALNQMQLPETVTSIGKYAYAFSGLTSVHIPADLTSIGDGAFGACYLLTRITADAGHTVYAAVDNVLFSKDITTVYCVPASRIDSYTLPDTVQFTAPCSFYLDKFLTEVILPEGLQEIQHNSFYSCISLQSIAIPGTVMDIGRMGFYDCRSLRNVSFGENSQLQRLGLSTFVNCGMSEITIPASVETMAQYVFSNCSNLKRITFAQGSKLPYVSAHLLTETRVEEIVFEDGSALTHLQAHAFDGAEYLKSVDFGDAALETIDNYAFYNCAALEQITIPETVTYLGRYAFYGCVGLDRLDIPATMDYIGISAFNGTNSMKIFFESDTLPANVQVGWDMGIAGYFLAAKEFVVTDDWEYIVTHSGNAALARYTGSAAKLTIDTVDGYRVEKIGAGCFEGNNTLTAVMLSASVREIDNYAFRNSSAIVTIPADAVLERIGDYAFRGNATESLTLPDTVIYIGSSAFEDSNLKKLDISKDSTLQSIGDRAFCGSSIESIYLPASTEKVGAEAFKDTVSLTAVTIADGDTTLKLSNSAFEGSGITGITVPTRVNYIGEYTFGNCPNLENIHIDDANTAYQDLDGVLLDSSGTTLIQYPGGRGGAFEVPSQINVLNYASFKNTKGLTEVTFAEGSNVKTIGWQIFSGCESLRKITVPDTVISFDFYAFENCTSLTEVVLGEGNQLTGIYEGAFYGCTQLTGLNLPDTVIDIGDYAFYGCTGLTEFPLSENAQTKGIGAYAFDGCSGITVVPTLANLADVGEYAFAHTAISAFTASAALKEITNSAFYGCEKLMNIYCDEANEEYTAIDGVLYEKGAAGADDYDALVAWPYGKVLVIGAGKTVITAKDTAILFELPDVQWTTAETVTEIGANAFRDHKLLKTVTVANQITEVGADAFRDCLSLEKVYFNAVNMNDLSASSDIFNNAGKAREGIKVIVGPQVTRIPAYLFERELYFPHNITDVQFAESGVCSEIGASAFSGCEKLSEIMIPTTVTAIGDNCFRGCSGLTHVILPSGATTFGRNVFGDCSRLMSAGPIGGGYNLEFGWSEYIPAYAFYGFDVMSSIVFPEGITSIGKSAFAYCTSLTQLTIPEGVSEICSDAFWNSGLSNIRIPQTVNKMGTDVFHGCTGLRTAGPVGSRCSIEFAWTRELPSNALQGCNTLKTITLPDTITSIGYDAISDCTGVETLYYNITALDDLTASDAIWDYLGNAGKGVTLVIGANVTRIPAYFTNCSMLLKRPNIHSVVFEEGSICSYIGAYAFERCVNLSSIVIPETVTGLGSNAFYGCTGLRSIGPVGSGCDIEYAWTDTIPRNMFTGLTGLTKVIFTETVVPKDGSPLAGCSALKSAGPIGGGYDVEFGWTSSIPAYVFSGCSSLTEVVLPDSLTTIGTYAFNNCTGITKIVIPASVTTIGSAAFSRCTGFTTAGPVGGEYDFEFGWTETIPSYAFQGCSKLTDINIPNGITHIGSYAFAGCTSLMDISIPENLVAMDNNVFDGCTGLNNIVLPESVQVIGSNAFNSCTALKRILIPENVTSMGKYAFNGCTALEEIIYNAKAMEDTDSNNYFFANAGTSGSGITVTFGAEVTKIPAYLLWPSTSSGYTPNIVRIVFEEGSVCDSIGTYAFAYCKGLTEITLPEGLTTINSYCFNGCSGLTRITVPESVTTIKSGAFNGCSGLVSAGPVGGDYSYEFGWTESIPAYAFYDCKKMVSVVIPEKITSIGKSAFSGCTALEDIRFCATAMADLASNNWIFAKAGRDGSGITVTIAKNVTRIPTYLFCPVASSSETPNIVQVIFEEESVCESIGRQAFYYCSSLRKIVIPEYTTSIDYYTFYNCTNLVTVQIESHTIAQEITSAASCGFLCQYAETILIPEKVSTVGAYIVDNFIYEEKMTCDGVRYTVYSKHAHSWDTGVIVTEPVQCQREGVVAYTCTTCALVKQEIVSCHTLIGHDGREPTCTTHGWEPYNVCSDCGYTDYEQIPATGHHYEAVVKAPTCTAQGYTAYTCTACGDSYVDTYVDALGHDMGEWTTVTEATCTETGSERRDCSRCDHYETRTIMATGHSYEHVVTAPTCVEKGFVTHTCSACGDSYVDTYVDALGHDMGEWITVTEATCTEDGSERRDCSRCDHYETRTIKAAGHSFGVWFVNRSATCMEDGENRRNCTKCSYYETEVIPATGHDYESVVTAPTCTEQGYTTHTCTTCGDTYVDTYVDTLGHDISIWKAVTEATCTTDGSERRDCSRCDYYETRVIEATGHSFGAWFVNRVATCTEDGETRRNCSNCSHYETEVISATGHDYESIVTAPTCTEQGYTTHTCTNCSDSYVDTYVDALGHDLGEWKTVTEAACTEDGSESRDCSRCDHYETRTIKATGHSFGIWFVNRSATCMEDGENRRNCTKCSYYETEVIPATGHDYESVVTVPTCTEQGFTTHTCSACGDSYVDRYTAAMGHDWDEGIVTVEPTEDAVGEMTYTCERCGQTRTEIIPELEHEHRYDAVITDPTCTAKGYTTHTCRCGDSYVDTYVDAVGHDMGEWTIVMEATCTEDGSERRDCSRCDHYETRTIEATGHSFGAWFVNRAATCTEAGENCRNCSACSNYETEVIPATGHSYEAVVSAPTCVEQGYTTHACANCGDSYVDTYVDALGHDMGEWATVTEATCTKDGSERRDCSRCDHYETRIIKATGHSFSAWFVNRSATCTKDGENRRNCSACSNYETEVIPATGHSYEAVVSAPTCVEQGYTTHACANCGDSYVDAYVDALGHDMGDWTIVTAATCTADGSERRDCYRCDHYETRVIKAAGHSYESVVTVPTCTERGYTTHTCSACGDSYVDSYVDALGHDMGEWITLTEETCTEAGSERRDCSRCDHYETRTIEAFGHSYESIVTAPTCTEQGYTRYDCSACGDSYSSDYMAPTGHAHESVVTDPTCTEQGYTTYTCHCGDRYVSDYTDPLGHDMGAWEISNAATCIEDGQELRECSCCDYSEIRAIEALGHDWNEGIVTIEPTEETTGEMTYTCERCSKTRTEIVPTLEHEHCYEAVITDPTCTEQGYTTHTCRCGDSYVDSYVDALGHDMGEWFIVTEATCTADGMEQRDCSRCEYHETQVIEATGHDYEIIVIEPDCIAQGYTTHICTNCGDSYIDSYTAAQGHSFTAYVSDGNATCTQDGTKTSVCDRCDATDTVADEGSALGHGFTEWTMVQKPTETVEGLESRYCLNCGVEETRAVACLENPFADVTFGSFYYEPVMWAVENGITSGTSVTTFGPNDQCMRAHVVTFLWRAVGSPEPTQTDNPFVDVKPTDFYYKPVLWAVENGITSGMDATHFGPTAYCNRAQVVTFLHRAKGSPAPERMELPFTDVAANVWYAAPVAWAVENGITAGLTATTFGPNAICNRAQIVTFLYRAFVND